MQEELQDKCRERGAVRVTGTARRESDYAGTRQGTAW